MALRAHVCSVVGITDMIPGIVVGALRYDKDLNAPFQPFGEVLFSVDFFIYNLE